MPVRESTHHLVQNIWENQDIPGAWDSVTPEDRERAHPQIDLVFDGFQAQFSETVSKGLPEASEVKVHKITAGISFKAVAFSSALAAGQIKDTEGLTDLSLAIGDMYLADQTMDHGKDPAMPASIEHFYTGDGILPDIPGVSERASILRDIPRRIGRFALPDDQPIVYERYGMHVLLRELWVQRLSTSFQTLQNEAERETFLKENSRFIAELLVNNAGAPSVSDSLYALYRRSQPGRQLDSLAVVHSEPYIESLIMMGNAAARAVDDKSDRQEDAGHIPGGNAFNLNVINQSHPDLVDAFFRYARVPEKERPGSFRAIKAFRDDIEDKGQYGDAVQNLFLYHIVQQVSTVPEHLNKSQLFYVELFKRVLTIALAKGFNDKGDQELTALDTDTPAE